MTAREPGAVPKAVALAGKDLRIELRSRDTIAPMLAFSVAVVVLLAFALPATSRLTVPVSVPAGTASLGQVLAGFLWVTVLFAGLIGFARTLDMDRDDDALEAILLAPLDRSAVFLAKAATNLVFVVGLQILLVPAFSLLFGIELWSKVGALVVVILLADIGFVAVGTLFSCLAAQTRSRELILPILALPALVPLFIAALELTADIFLGDHLTAVAERGWFSILIAFDLVLGTTSALAFDLALE